MPDGTLMATASQSVIVRFWKDRPQDRVERIADQIDKAGIEVSDKPPR